MDPSIRLLEHNQQKDVHQVRMYLKRFPDAELHNILFTVQTTLPAAIETELEARSCLAPEVQCRQDEMRASVQIMQVHLRRHLRDRKPLDPQMVAKGEETQKIASKMADYVKKYGHKTEGTYLIFLQLVLMTTSRAVMLVCVYGLCPEDVSRMKSHHLDAFIDWICLYEKCLGSPIIEEWAVRLEIPTWNQIVKRKSRRYDDGQPMHRENIGFFHSDML